MKSRLSAVLSLLAVAAIFSGCDNLGEILEQLAKQKTSSGFSIVSFSPADGFQIPASTTQNGSVTFSTAADSSTITVQTTTGTCTGSIQISTDGFSTCQAFTAQPTSPDSTAFNFSFNTANFCGGGSIRFLTDIKSSSGTALSGTTSASWTGTGC